MILKKLQATDHLVLLDEKGKEFRSVQFAAFLQKKMNSGCKQVVFVVGGPYGFSEAVYKKTIGKVSLSTDLLLWDITMLSDHFDIVGIPAT